MKKRRILMGSLVGAGLIVVAALGVGYWILASGKANGFIHDYLEDELTTQLGMPARIGHIKGNPFGRYRIMDIRLGDMLSIDTIGVRYEPVLALKVGLDSLLIKGIQVQVPPSSGEDEPMDLRNVRTFIPFKIDNLVIERGTIGLEDGQSVSHLQFQGGFSAEGDEFRLEVKRYQSQQFEPPLIISNLQGVGILDGGKVALKDVSVTFPNTQIYVNGTLGYLDQPEFDLTYKAEPLVLKDFKTFLEEEIPDLSFVIDGSLRGDLQSAHAELTVQLDSTLTQLTIKGALSPLDTRVDANIVFKAFDSKSIYADVTPIVIDGNLKGIVHVNTTGVTRGNVEGQLTRLVVDQIEQRQTDINLAYDQGNISGQVQSVGEIGEVDINGTYHLENEKGNGEVVFKGLNVSLLPDAPPEIGSMNGRVVAQMDSAINAKINVSRLTYDGMEIQNVKADLAYVNNRVLVDGFEVDLQEFGTQLSGSGQVDMGQAVQVVTLNVVGSTDLYKVVQDTVLGERLDFDTTFNLEIGESITGNGLMVGEWINFGGGLDSLRMETVIDSAEMVSVLGDVWGRSGHIDITGQVGLAGKLGLDLKGVVPSLSTLSSAIGYTVEGDSLHFETQIGGTFALPQVRFQIKMPEIEVASVPIENIAVSGEWTYPDTAALTVRIDTLSWGDRKLGNVFLDAKHQATKTGFRFGSDATKADRIYLKGVVENEGEKIQVAVDSMYVQASQVAFYNQKPLQVEYDPVRGFQIDHFELVGPAGRVIARDHPDMKSAIDIVLNDIDLRPWAFLFGQPHISGRLNAELALSGGLDDPLVYIEGNLVDVEVYGGHIPKITTNLSFGDNRLVVDVVLVPKLGKPLTVSGSVPINLDDPVQLDIQSGGLSIALLDSFVAEVNAIDGKLTLDMSIRGTPNAPTYQGHIKLVEGKIDHALIGRVYEPIYADIKIDQNNVRVDSLKIGKQGQHLIVSGFANVKEGLLSDFDVRVDLKSFQPIRWPEIKAEYTGQLHLEGTYNRPRLTGNLQIQQADIRLGELMGGPSSGWDQSPFVKGLLVNMSVKADQQVWVRDQTFNIEMTGDLEVIKDGDGVKLFGNMQSRRGNYVFQNRRLDIAQAEIQFQGKTVIDPSLDIEAQTRVMARFDDGQDMSPKPVTVIVSVGGTLSQPEIKLSSEPPVGQFDDILSVLLIGATRNAVAASNASDLVLGTLANRFGQRLGDDLKLDLVEVDVSESNISRVRVGKYITNRLFVSYAQDMSSTGREVAVEFQLLKSVTIEAKQIDAGNEDQINENHRESIGIVWEKEW